MINKKDNVQLIDDSEGTVDKNEDFGEKRFGVQTDVHESMPESEDILNQLRFRPEKGQIWLSDRRMFLFHTKSFGVLRQELIEGMGIEQARGLLSRIGYQSGSRDAEMARQVRGNMNPLERFAIGPQLHALEGLVLVEPVKVDIDVASGHYYGEFIWRNSVEDEVHLATYGLSSEPVCWMQIGYACGYTSAFMGRAILYREVECQSMGHPHCRIIGKPVDDWEDAEEDIRYFNVRPSNATIVDLGAQKTALVKTSTGTTTTNRFEDRKLVGMSAGFNVVCHMINRVAATDAPVLFLGESGVGKEIFARTLHESSKRSHSQFVAINCAAIPDQLIESELFGVEKGAFTGAIATRLGRFERASGGTLFLDEVGCLSLTAQGKLLRALQEGEIERIGDTKIRRIDVRVIAATNEDLRLAVKHKTFREDLFYRLNIFPIEIPPLRDRTEDVSVLSEYFLQRHCRIHNRNIPGFSARAVDTLMEYAWPGNVRELENVIERAVILAADNKPIERSHLAEIDLKKEFVRHLLRSGEITAKAEPSPRQSLVTNEKRSGSSVLPYQDKPAADTLEAVLSAKIRSAIEHHHGNLAAAARELDITRAQIAYRAKKLGLASLCRRRS